MANIRTIALNGAETKVEIAGQNCAVRNDGTETVYASRRTGIIAGADGVLAVPAGQSAVLRDTCGTLYLLGTGSVQLVGADYDSLPFKTVSASGGSGADEVARAAISAHAGNAEVHVTTDEKSAWNAKAELSDIPTSLPANGGNADTLAGKAADTFLQDKGYLLKGDLLEHILTMTDSGWFFASSNVTNVPLEGLWFWIEVRKDDRGNYLVIAYRYNGQGGVYTNRYNNNADMKRWYGWTNAADNGNAASVGTYTEAKIAALEARIAALEGGA